LVALVDDIGATDVEHFPELEVEVRDYIAGMTDADPDDLAVRWRYEVNGRDVTDAQPRFLAVERELHEIVYSAPAGRREPSVLQPVSAKPCSGVRCSQNHCPGVRCQRSPAFFEQVGQAFQPCAWSTFWAMAICCAREAPLAVLA